MVYTGHLNKVPLERFPEENKSQAFHCMRILGPVTVYILLLCAMLVNLPHDVEWDLDHILFPILPAILMGTGGFFFMIYVVFGEQFRTQLTKKNA